MFAIDYQDRRPVFEQIVDRYELLIAGGVLLTARRRAGRLAR